MKTTGNGIFWVKILVSYELMEQSISFFDGENNMLESTFLHEFRLAGGARITENLILFHKPLQVYNLASDETTYFDSVNDMFAFVAGSRTVRDIISEAKPDDIFRLVLNGGRGSGSDNWTGKFSHASGGNGKDNTRSDFPARVNGIVKIKNAGEALRMFRQLHVTDDYESAITVDENGYVTQYVHGNATSVGIWGRKGEMVYHNHPSFNGAKGGNFSDGDLLSTATSAERGIVASAKEGDYRFEKGTHFDTAGFVKAVRNATLKGKDYSDAADKWLRRNQRKYGYRYSFTKA